jgi:hypothetical protein
MALPAAPVRRFALPARTLLAVALAVAFWNYVLVVRLPPMEASFAQMNAQLPAVTHDAIAVSHALHRPQWIAIWIGALAAVVLLRWLVPALFWRVSLYRFVSLTLLFLVINLLLALWVAMAPQYAQLNRLESARSQDLRPRPELLCKLPTCHPQAPSLHHNATVGYLMS